jgi:hypothetical protein
MQLKNQESVGAMDVLTFLVICLSPFGKIQGQFITVFYCRFRAAHSW